MGNDPGDLGYSNEYTTAQTQREKLLRESEERVQQNGETISATDPESQGKITFVNDMTVEEMLNGHVNEQPDPADEDPELFENYHGDNAVSVSSSGLGRRIVGKPEYDLE